MSRFEKLNGGKHVPLVMTELEKRKAEEIEQLTAQAFTLVLTSLAETDPFTATSVAVHAAGALLRRAEKMGLDKDTIARCLASGMHLVDSAMSNQAAQQAKQSANAKPSEDDLEC